MNRVFQTRRWSFPIGGRSWLLAATLSAMAAVTGLPASRAGDSLSGSGTAAPEDIESLLSRLRNPSAARRREALLRLTDTRVDSGRALPRIWPLLQDGDPMVRAQAARAVWLIGQKVDAAVITLNGLLDPEQPQACALASFLVGEIGPSARAALPALRARMTESDPLLRLHAAEAIAKIDPSDAAAHTALLLAIHDKSSDVRYFAACALLTAGESYDEPVRAALLEAITDDDLRVASAAALSLESRPAAEGSPAGQPLVPSPELNRLMSNVTDANPAVRRRAALRLAELGEAAAPAVRTLRQRLADDDPLVRAYVAYALWQTTHQPTTVVPALIDLLGTLRPNVTTLATSVLARIGPPAADALPALYDLAESKNRLVQLHTAIAISRIDPRARDAVVVLCSTAHDDDSDLRYLATLSLGHVSLLSRKRAERELTTALGDRNLRVRAAADLALETLQTAIARSRIPVDFVAERDSVAERVSARAEEERAPAIAAAVDAETPDTVAIPALQEEPYRPTPQPSGDPDISGKTYDIDEVTVEERKSISELRARITPSEGDMPIDHAGPRFAQEPVNYHGFGMERGWIGSSFAWNNPGVCHQPLYYQDLNLERYGYHYGCAQTFVSSVKFLADTALLPYKVVCYPYCDCYYTLGYDRPGNCVPYRCYRLPLRTDAAAVLTGVGVGLFFLAPP